MFVVELAEGNAHPRQAGTLEFEDIDGNNVGLLLRMMKSYFVTGRYVIIDSGFCVLKGFIQLSKKGGFDCVVIKNRRYWTYMVPSKYMEDHFGGVDVGETDIIHGTVDDAFYNLWSMKEPNYVMRMMATGGRLLADDKSNETVRRWKETGEDVVNKFKYNLTFDCNFRYHHAVDNHKNIRHALPSIEDTRMADRWECRVFAFILAISEVYTILILRYFVYCVLRRYVVPALMEFYRKLSWNIINNIHIEEQEGGG